MTRGKGFRIRTELCKAAILVLCTLHFALPLPAHATPSSIAAVVNQEAVTESDISERLDFLLLESDNPDTDTTRQAMRGQVLQTLIDERLQIQDAAAQGIRIKAEAITDYAQKLGVSLPGELPATIRQRIEAQMALEKVIARRIRPEIVVSATEVMEAQATAGRAAAATEVMLEQAFVPILLPEDAEHAQTMASRIVAEVRRGADLSRIADYFPAPGSDHAQDGWIRIVQLPEGVRHAVANLKPGVVSDPIRTAEGFYVVQVKDTHQISYLSSGEPMARIRQIVIPLSKQATSTQLGTAQEEAESLRTRITTCESMESVARATGYLENWNLGWVALAKLSPALREVIDDLPLGTVSAPMRSGTGVHLLMVCERETPTPITLDPKEVEQQLLQRKLAFETRRYLQNLRRSAFIEMR